jgi:hypothetical protein
MRSEADSEPGEVLVRISSSSCSAARRDCRSRSDCPRRTLATGWPLFLLRKLRKRASHFGISPDDAADLGVWVLLAGLVGAKLLLRLFEDTRRDLDITIIMHLSSIFREVNHSKP